MEKIVYLHGFASSPRSRKGTILRLRLHALGFAVDIPNLEEGDFRQLTISRQLELIRSLLHAPPVVVIGSSLGGYLAALAAARYPEAISRVILIAPAFDLARSWQAQLGPERMAAWKREGSMSVYHYGAGRQVPIGYHLIEDAAQYEGFPNLQQPTLIIHGTRDAVVPIELAQRFVATHANARLLELPSGHELTDVLEDISDAIEKFLFTLK